MSKRSSRKPPPKAKPKREAYGEPVPAEEAPFLKQVLAEPDDDEPRLVFADWLEERGDPRARLIRVQCQLAKTSRDAPARPALEAEEQTLLKKHQAKWLRRQPDLEGIGWGVAHELVDFSSAGGRCHFSRGFVEYATPKTFVPFQRHADRLACETLARRFRFMPLRPRELEILLASPMSARLRGLFLPIGRIGDAGARVLADSAIAASLEEVNLSGCHVGDDGLEALLGKLQRIRRLEIGFNRLTERGIRLLASWPGLAQVDTLAVDLASSTAQTFLASPYLGRLAALSVTGLETAPCVFGPALHGLRRLAIALHDVPIESFQPICQFPHLEHLNLHGNVGDDVIDVLIAAKSLKSVVMRFTAVSPEGAERLRQARPELKLDYKDAPWRLSL